MRVGQGYDVHRLVEGKDLFLCGVKMPFELGLDGHSDADVALHALCDALLGAAAMGDIGTHFPDTDFKYKGISSMVLTKETADKIRNAGFEIGNVDITIIAQKPKILPYIQQMRENVSNVLEINITDVNVKATTTEKLGFVGRVEGIASMAIVMLK